MRRFSVKRGVHGDTDYLEMVEDADGPYCLVGDATAAVQGEREAIFSDLQSLRDAAEEADDEGTAIGIGVAQEAIRLRSAPAVDVMAVVREAVRKLEGIFAGQGRTKDEIAKAHPSSQIGLWRDGVAALRSLVSGEAKAKTDTRDTSAFTQEYNGSFVPHSKGEEKEKP